MEQAKHPTPTVRLARPSDVPLLGSVESSAATLFSTFPSLAHHSHGPPVPQSELEIYLSANNLWVAVDDADAPIGFLCGHSIDSSFYIAEISVAEDWQKKGVGRSLIERMCKDVKILSYSDVILTTYRDVPWNGPWYIKVGFEELHVKDWGEQITKKMELEKSEGFDMERRCVMKRVL
jgi:GNAT superfamily N-acetyltransferase